MRSAWKMLYFLNNMYIVPNGEERFLTIKAVDICSQKSAPTAQCKYFITLRLGTYTV